MPFIKVPGLAGKLYVPDDRPPGSKKHPCRDCFGCQQCSDDRCCLCRSEWIKGKKAACGEVNCC
jgi:hypothetical protein